MNNTTTGAALPDTATAAARAHTKNTAVADLQDRIRSGDLTITGHHLAAAKAEAAQANLIHEGAIARDAEQVRVDRLASYRDAAELARGLLYDIEPAYHAAYTAMAELLATAQRHATNYQAAYGQFEAIREEAKRHGERAELTAAGIAGVDRHAVNGVTVTVNGQRHSVLPVKAGDVIAHLLTTLGDITQLGHPPRWKEVRQGRGGIPDWKGEIIHYLFSYGQQAARQWPELGAPGGHTDTTGDAT